MDKLLAAPPIALQITHAVGTALEPADRKPSRPAAEVESV